MWVWFLNQEDALQEGMITHSSTLAWRIPWTEEPGGLQSIGSHRVGHDWSNLARAYIGRFCFCLHLTDSPLPSNRKPFFFVCLCVCVSLCVFFQCLTFYVTTFFPLRKFLILNFSLLGSSSFTGTSSWLLLRCEDKRWEGGRGRGGWGGWWDPWTLCRGLGFEVFWSFQIPWLGPTCLQKELKCCEEGQASVMNLGVLIRPRTWIFSGERSFVRSKDVIPNG